MSDTGETGDRRYPEAQWESPVIVRPLMGLATVAVIVGIVAVVVTLFRGSFSETAPVTVLSPRAGLVMYPNANVKMRGAMVGSVASIQSLPNGQAAIHLATDPSQLHFIPANVLVDNVSTTVFGSKFVQLFAMTGLTPADAHVAELHDFFTGVESISYEDLGFADRFGVHKLVEAEVTGIGGSLLVSPSARLKSKGHSLGATGVAQCVEVFEQLRGDACNRIDGARIALAHNIGGPTAVSAMTIPEGPEASGE
jgi:hypothetical protein